MNQSTKSGFFKDPQNIIAVGVTIISLCALIVSLMQTRIMQEERELMREYSRASVWPRLELKLSKAHGERGEIVRFNLSLTNSGVGPAIISDVKVMYKGEMASNWWHLFEIQAIPDSIETYIDNSPFNGNIIKIGETREIINLDNNPLLAQAFLERLGDLSMDIYYESIYGDVWKYELGEQETETIELEKGFDGLPEEEQFEN